MNLGQGNVKKWERWNVTGGRFDVRALSKVVTGVTKKEKASLLLPCVYLDIRNRWAYSSRSILNIVTFTIGCKKFKALEKK